MHSNAFCRQNTHIRLVNKPEFTYNILSAAAASCLLQQQLQRTKRNCVTRQPILQILATKKENKRCGKMHKNRKENEKNGLMENLLLLLDMHANLQ